MSDPRTDSSDFDPDRKVAVEPEFHRSDMTGGSITKWTTKARAKLASMLQSLADAAQRGKDAKVLGSDHSVGDTTERFAGKTVKSLEAKLDQVSTENKLKLAQTETEFVKQELLRAQVEQTKETTKSQQLDNAKRELELHQQIIELTQGRADIHFTWDEDRPILIIGKLPPDGDKDADQAETE